MEKSSGHKTELTPEHKFFQDPHANVQVNRAITELTWDSLRPVAFALAGLYIFFAIGHLFLLAAEIKVVMSALAGGTALIMLVLGTLVGRNSFSERWTYPLAFFLIGLTILNSLLHIFLTEDITQTTNLMLVIFGAGYFIISRKWFWTSLALTIGGWVFFVMKLPNHELAIHFGIAIISTGLISIIFNQIRNRTLRNAERFRLRGKYQQTELEKNFVATAEAQERYQRLTEATFDGIVIHEQGAIVDANTAFAEMFGYSHQEVIGQSVLDFTAAEDQERSFNYMRWGYEQSYEITGVKKDQTTFPIELTARQVSHKGRALRVVVVRDLTAFKAAQQERDRFFNLSIDMLCVIGFDGHFKHLSPAFENTLGFTYQEMLDQPFLDFVHPEDQENSSQHFQSVLLGADVLNYENRFLTQDGACKWILWNATAFAEANLIYAIGRDITKQKENTLALQEREERINAILNTTVDGIIVINEAGLIQSFNKAAGHIFGYSEAEVIGKNVHMLMPDPYHHEHDGYVGAYLETRKPKIIGKGREVQGIRKDGEIFPLALAVSNVELPGRTLFTGIVRDITQRVQAEEALRMARERLQNEIDLAAQIQSNLLSRAVPQFDTFEVGAIALPARFLSGDFYDFSALDENIEQFVLGDIAGKGIPAALLTLSTRSLIRAEAEIEKSPAKILTRINRDLYSDLDQAEVFITLFIAQLNLSEGSVQYASAGHGEALIWRFYENEIQALEATGLPVGIFPDETYSEHNIAMRPGDVLLIYSDGVTDATNSAEEQFGLDRLNAIICQTGALSAPEITAEIVSQVQAFSGGQEQDDDISILVIKALPRQIIYEAPGTLENMDGLIATIRENAAIYGPDFAYEIELASSEAITNIVEHAYRTKSGPIRMEIQLEAEAISLDFYDQGGTFAYDPSAAPNPEDLLEGGYGLSIMTQVFDEVIYEPDEQNGNHWRLIKALRGG